MPNGSGQGDVHAIAGSASDLARQAFNRVTMLEERVLQLERTVRDLMPQQLKHELRLPTTEELERAAIEYFKERERKARGE